MGCAIEENHHFANEKALFIFYYKKLALLKKHFVPLSQVSHQKKPGQHLSRTAIRVIADDKKRVFRKLKPEHFVPWLRVHQLFKKVLQTLVTVLFTYF